MIWAICFRPVCVGNITSKQLSTSWLFLKRLAQFNKVWIKGSPVHNGWLSNLVTHTHKWCLFTISLIPTAVLRYSLWLLKPIRGFSPLQDCFLNTEKCKWRGFFSFLFFTSCKCSSSKVLPGLRSLGSISATLWQDLASRGWKSQGVLRLIGLAF